MTLLPPSGREGDRGGAVEGERDCVFSELEVKLWAEGDGVCFPQNITLIYLLNEPVPSFIFSVAEIIIRRKPIIILA